MIDSNGHAVSLLLGDQAFVKEHLIVIVKPELFGQKPLFLLLSVSGFVSQNNPSPHNRKVCHYKENYSAGKMIFARLWWV